jgi:hypothetical protein
VGACDRHGRRTFARVAWGVGFGVLVGVLVPVPVSAAWASVLLSRTAGSPTGPVFYSEHPPENEVPVAGLELGECWDLFAPPDPQIAAECMNAYRVSFDASRREDGVQGALALPSNWTSLTNPEQHFVLVNVTRIAYGEQPLIGLTPLLDEGAQQGAAAGEDSPWQPYGSEFAQPTGELHGTIRTGLGGYFVGGYNPPAVLWVMLYADGCGGGYCQQ